MYQIDIGPNSDFHEDIRAGVNWVHPYDKLQAMSRLEIWTQKRRHIEIDRKANEVVREY